MWRFIGIYGWLEFYNKEKIFEMLVDIKTYFILFWVIGGDLNEIIFNFEKGGILKD